MESIENLENSPDIYKERDAPTAIKTIEMQTGIKNEDDTLVGNNKHIMRPETKIVSL